MHDVQGACPGCACAPQGRRGWAHTCMSVIATTVRYVERKALGSCPALLRYEAGTLAWSSMAMSKIRLRHRIQPESRHNNTPGPTSWLGAPFAGHMRFGTAGGLPAAVSMGCMPRGRTLALVLAGALSELRVDKLSLACADSSDVRAPLTGAADSVCIKMSWVVFSVLCC